MPWTPKQTRFFEAVKHGMKPKNGSKLTPNKAANLLREAREGDSGKGMALSEADYRPKKAKRGRVRAR